MKSGWVFRIEVVSEQTLYTKDMVKELNQRLLDSKNISQVLVEELYEEIKLFKKQPKKKKKREGACER